MKKVLMLVAVLGLTTATFAQDATPAAATPAKKHHKKHHKTEMKKAEMKKADAAKPAAAPMKPAAPVKK